MADDNYVTPLFNQWEAAVAVCKIIKNWFVDIQEACLYLITIFFVDIKCKHLKYTVCSQEKNYLLPCTAFI